MSAVDGRRLDDHEVVPSRQEIAMFTKCPLCQQVKMKEHCESGNCSWFWCRNEACAAVLDPTERIGHVLLPVGERTKRDDKGNPITHRRLALVAGTWVSRDAA